MKRKALFSVLIMLFAVLSVSAQVAPIKHNTPSKPPTTTTSAPQFKTGQYLACTKDGVALRSGPAKNKSVVNAYDLRTFVLGPKRTDFDGRGGVDINSNSNSVYFWDLGIKYLGKKQNGYLYVEATRDGDIFDDVVVKGWIPEQYVRLGCQKCRGTGFFVEEGYVYVYSDEKCPKCHGRRY